MLTATLKSLLSRKLRLLMSGLAVVLAVMFVSGSMVIKDTLGRSFDAQFTGAYEDLDLHVSLKPKVKAETGGPASVVPALDAAAVNRVAAASGVDKSLGIVKVEGARVLGKDRKLVPSTGGPRYGEGWRGESELLSLRSGRGPRAAEEVAINATLAEKAGFKAGDRIEVLTSEPKKSFTVVGVFGYSEGRDSIGGEQTVAFTEPVAQQLMLGKPGAFSGIGVVTDSGASAASVKGALVKELGNDYTVATGEEFAKKESDKSSAMLDMISQLLLGFAGIAVFVSVFLIVNTFSIIIAQRLRELALLRALGASRRQMINSVLLESFAIGLVSSVLGLAAGVGVGALGSSLAGGSIEGLEIASLGVPASAVVTSFAVGIVVTMLAALFPALRASRVAPIAVIRAAATPDHKGRKQTWIGAILLALGVVLVTIALVGSSGMSTMLPAVMLSFVGIALLAPLVSRPAVWAIGVLFSRALPGQLGRRNAARNPRRTAVTASAIMIGVALVTAVSTLAASFESSVTDEFKQTLKSDLVAKGDGPSAQGAPMDPDALAQAARVPGVKQVAIAMLDSGTVDEKAQKVTSWQDWDKARDVLGVTAKQGSLLPPPAGSVVMDEASAKAHSAKVGDKITVQLQRGEPRTYQVAGIFENSTFTNSIVVPWDDAQTGFSGKLPSQAFFELEDGTATSAVVPQIDELLKDSSPEAKVMTKAEVRDEFSSAFALQVTVVQALLGVAMLIAVLGIINTLALSILERTAELGALRAIGLGRGQTVRMIMTESMLISLFGAVLGLVVGSVLGLAMSHALEDQGVSHLALPWSQMLAYLIGAAVVGIIASLAPARRGARLNVLHAISHS
ncbi:ABC transporter permease [Streptomyces sp. rh34]|uniref:ABC transporter permease n=1 Tax=Streptomyces sp. rh34 TaxID=2034272 RepID=UPI000BF044E3|nr:ABC transporter permease [Streptomyces sp. rh34]